MIDKVSLSFPSEKIGQTSQDYAEEGIKILIYGFYFFSIL
jgi:hypothetical protein